MKKVSKKLVLQDGQEFYGIGYGTDDSKVCDIVFNTSVVGYQEIISDPSYAERIVVMTYPLIGNYGITDEDFESRIPLIGGLIVRECCDTPSNFRYTKTLIEELEEHNIACLSEVDTRMLTKVIRNSGRPKGVIVDASMPVSEALKLISEAPQRESLSSRVSCKKRWFIRTPNHNYDVVAIDCGIKYNIIQCLKERGCNVTIVPFGTAAKDIMAYNPDGVLFSNGPDSPAEVPGMVELFNEFKGRIPVLGIGLGQEIIGISYGAELKFMGCGIHGDHPVRDLESGRINIGVFNQEYVFENIEGTSLKASHVTVPEGYTVGFENTEDKVLGLQFHIESAPGPKDNAYLFDKFIKMMEDNRNA